MMLRHLSVRLYFTAVVLLVTAAAASAQDFEAEYEALIKEFPSSLPDTAAVESLMDRADELYKRVRQHRRDHRDNLSEEELDGLRDLYQEVRTFKSVIRVVGQAHNAANVSIEGFDKVNGRLSLEPEVLMTIESSVELVGIDVDGFRSLLLRNPTKTTFAVSYSVNDPERPGGVGSTNCESYSVMSGLFNTRDRNLDGLEFTTIQTRDANVTGCD